MYLKCQRYGFTSSTCESCFCPSGFSGKFCETPTPSTGECPSTSIHVSTKAQQIIYSTVNNNSQECYTQILAKSNEKIFLFFSKIENNLDLIACDYGDAYLEVKYKNDKSETGKQLGYDLFYSCF